MTQFGELRSACPVMYAGLFGAEPVRTSFHSGHAALLKLPSRILPGLNKHSGPALPATQCEVNVHSCPVNSSIRPTTALNLLWLATTNIVPMSCPSIAGLHSQWSSHSVWNDGSGATIMSREPIVTDLRLGAQWYELASPMIGTCYVKVSKGFSKTRMIWRSSLRRRRRGSF